MTEDTVEEVWLHSAKAWSRMVPGGKQSRDMYDLALVQLQQHQRLALGQGQVHTQRRVRQCVQTALSRGAQTKGAVSKQVAQAGRTPVVRDVVVDLCAGRQSMEGPAEGSGYRYVAVELLAVIEALGGKGKAQVVLDISAVEPEELLRVIAEQRRRASSRRRYCSYGRPYRAQRWGRSTPAISDQGTHGTGITRSTIRRDASAEQWLLQGALGSQGHQEQRTTTDLHWWW